MTSRTSTILVWIPTVLLSLFFLMTAVFKFVPVPPGSEMEAMMQKIGTAGMEQALGVLQLVILVLFVVPRTSTVGFVLMVGYMGGALATNLTHGFTAAEAAPIYVFFGLMMLSAWFRLPELTARLRGKQVA